MKPYYKMTFEEKIVESILEGGITDEGFARDMASALINKQIPFLRLPSGKVIEIR